MAWTNKIVGHADAEVDDLLSNPDNWRIHTREQQEVLADTIGEIGFIRSVTVNQTTGHVVDGHLRVILAMRAGETSIPVEYVELTEEEEAIALATLDPIAGMAGADDEKIVALLDGIGVAGEALGGFLDSMREVHQARLAGVTKPEVDLGELLEKEKAKQDESKPRLVKFALPPDDYTYFLEALDRVSGRLGAKTLAAAVLAAVQYVDNHIGDETPAG